MAVNGIEVNFYTFIVKIHQINPNKQFLPEVLMKDGFRGTPRLCRASPIHNLDMHKREAYCRV